MICNACPRGCNVDREVSLGYCKSPEKFKLARASLHYWEEPCISGKNGSGAIFFSGCNLGCVFCQNYEISHGCKGVEVSDDDLVRIMKRLVDEGANNINFVNPTHYSLQLLRVLEKYKPPVPIVYNTSGYDSVETLKMLDGAVDIYLPDFKYIRPEKALKYSKAEDYPQVAEEALAEMKRQVGDDVFDENGIMQRGMIIRHLVLPSNTNSSISALDYLAENFGDTYISVMAQYVPCGDLTEYKEINRPLTQREYDKVVNHIFDLGLQKIFVQELEAASDKFIPDFDFTGVVDF
ncbi:radical SAM protein [Eubacterium coprostanoligenes]|uniref:radical SAM protein n=1 Tax=Eubacterium coprostanoligenes TaxID=290054 RepID=UPI0023523528|nr:radical SAM protein [Eubacterium coprostanoligenes]MCI6254687.1 radical SAM protein [Eubacterium coprostanoligenes]MDY5399409.1 radical SAM protein [Eubacterium coprostanoligenes]